MKLAESLSPITKKLEKLNESTQKVGDVLKEPNSEKNNIQANLKSLPNSTNFSISMRQIFGSLMNSPDSFKITQNESGRANILGVTVQISGPDTIKLNEKTKKLVIEGHGLIFFIFFNLLARVGFYYRWLSITGWPSLF